MEFKILWQIQYLYDEAKWNWNEWTILNKHTILELKKLLVCGT